MNTDILKKYDVDFYTNNRGERFVDVKNMVGSFVYLSRTKEDIDDVLQEIDLCLNGQLNSVDPDYSAPIFGLYGEFTDKDFLILSKDGTVHTVVPLVDFRELLLCWKEFFNSYI